MNLRDEMVTVIVDSREQAPYDLSPMKTEVATLRAGDYSVSGLSDVVTVERKSVPDLARP